MSTKMIVITYFIVGSINHYEEQNLESELIQLTVVRINSTIHRLLGEILY